MRVNIAIFGFISLMLFSPMVLLGAETSNILSEADFRIIDAYIERELKEANIPGAALVIVEGKQVTHLRGFGIAGPQEAPVTAETGFFLGSVSKSFTALAVMQLVEAGQIELDAPVQKYLPWFRVADPEASRQMKVRHLLNHTSGFSTYAGRTHFNSSDMSNEAIERRVRALRKAELTAAVGEGIYYSNANYSILGAIIESASGQRYEDYIQAHIFDPLKMTHSYTSERMAKQQGLATGYRYWFGRPFAASDIPHSRGDLPVGYLISCAKDMGNYLLAHMNGGILGEARILSTSGVTKMHTPEKNRNYAMGWGVGEFAYTRIFSHGGSTPNYHAEMAIFPDYKRAFVLLVNAENWLSGPVVGALGWNMRSLILGNEAPPIKKAPKVHIDLAMLCALLLGQVIGFASGARQICRWRKRPDTRPRRKRWIILTRGGLSITADIGIAVGLLWWVPRTREVPLSCLMLYAPDAGWLLLLNGALALMAFVVSIGATIFLLQQSGHSDTVIA